jgi:hypothetical protein
MQPPNLELTLKPKPDTTTSHMLTHFLQTKKEVGQFEHILIKSGNVA